MVTEPQSCKSSTRDTLATQSVSTPRPHQQLMEFVGPFHVAMAAGVSLLVLVTIAGCTATGIHSAGFTANWFPLLALAAMLLPLPMHWFEKDRRDLMDAALLIAWALLEALVVPYTVRVAARLKTPLRDGFFGRADDLLGVRVPDMMTWASHTWLGSAINGSYMWVLLLMPVSVLIPILAGKREYAKKFVASNLVSFAIGIPLFALAPAVGPWKYYHFAPSALQWSDCESVLAALRLPGPYLLGSQGAGVVCFPSFHVVWAILCASALWGFRYTRVPVCIVCSMIVLSTMTTGWHYFTDVLGGLAVAAVSLYLVARRLA